VKKLLTLAQTAERTNLTEKALRMRIWRKEFPATKIKGRVFVEENELERFLTLSTKTTAEEAAAKLHDAA